MYVKNKKSRSIVASHIIAQGGRGGGKYFMERRSPVAKIIGPLGLRIQWPDNRTLLSETGGHPMLTRHRRTLPITIGYLNLSILEYGQKG